VPDLIDLLLAWWPVILIAIVILIEHFWIVPSHIHPNTFLRILADRMATKVHPSMQRSAAQQRLSSVLAVLLLVLPIGICLAMVQIIVSSPELLNALLLFIALQFQPVVRQVKGIHRALSKEKKQLARNLLSSIVLRETSMLSPMGIAKASIESLMLRYCYQFQSVLFWFMLLDGAGAFTYRFLYEIHLAWPTKHSRFQYFGEPVRLITQAMQWLPTKLTLLIMALSTNASSAWKASSQAPKQFHSQTLAWIGGGLQIQLGGPALYQGVKVRYPKVGGANDIRLADMQRALNLIHIGKLITLLLVVLGNTIWLAVWASSSTI
jgi:adenosylcobinamide-phosphate synthase